MGQPPWLTSLPSGDALNPCLGSKPTQLLSLWVRSTTKFDRALERELYDQVSYDNGGGHLSHTRAGYLRCVCPPNFPNGGCLMHPAVVAGDVTKPVPAAAGAVCALSAWKEIGSLPPFPPDCPDVAVAGCGALLTRQPRQKVRHTVCVPKSFWRGGASPYFGYGVLYVPGPRRFLGAHTLWVCTIFVKHGATK